MESNVARSIEQVERNGKKQTMAEHGHSLSHNGVRWRAR